MWKSLILGAVVGGTAAFTQAPADTSEQRVQPNQDPNQVVCVNENEIGSRVSRRRVCRTRAEWAEIERQTRATLDRTQTYRPTCEPAGRC